MGLGEFPAGMDTIRPECQKKPHRKITEKLDVSLSGRNVLDPAGMSREN